MLVCHFNQCAKPPESTPEKGIAKNAFHEFIAEPAIRNDGNFATRSAERMEHHYAHQSPALVIGDGVRVRAELALEPVRRPLAD